MNITNSLRASLFAALRLSSNDNNTQSISYESKYNVVTNAPSIPQACRFAISDYRLLERAVCGASEDPVFNPIFPGLKEIRYTQKFCPVLIPGYVIFTVGLQDPSTIQSELVVNDFSNAEKKSKITIYEIENQGFVGSEIIAHNHDFLDDDTETANVNNINNIIASRKRGARNKNQLPQFEVTTNNFKRIVELFGSILTLVKMRLSMQPCIVYAGDISNEEVAGLIKTVNETIPVFQKIDAT